MKGDRYFGTDKHKVSRAKLAGLSGSNVFLTLAVSIACLTMTCFTLYSIDSKRRTTLHKFQ